MPGREWVCVVVGGDGRVVSFIIYVLLSLPFR